MNNIHERTIAVPAVHADALLDTLPAADDRIPVA
jgi:hypothetical protein